ncbi:hypothetical protein COO60DRAFT_1003141 [Scenedesmus sp. NREL 46B-D3]|nr:hypothetical protein COO60DRAFT_1003141 [Scenedesmus sp. NREL 46B-D3]
MWVVRRLGWAAGVALLAGVIVNFTFTRAMFDNSFTFWPDSLRVLQQIMTVQRTACPFTALYSMMVPPVVHCFVFRSSIISGDCYRHCPPCNTVVITIHTCTLTDSGRRQR